MKAKQQNLITKTWAKDRFAFGGSLLKNSNPKTKRRFVKGLPSHIVLKSSTARGHLSLLPQNRRIEKILSVHAQKHFIKILSVANAGNHLHILLQAPSREHQSNFLRAVSGHIALMMNKMMMNKISQSKSSQITKFWDARPFSRVVKAGRDLQNVLRYISINSTEIIGLPRDQVRKMFADIQAAIAAGQIPINRNIVAAGFG